MGSSQYKGREDLFSVAQKLPFHVTGQLQDPEVETVTGLQPLQSLDHHTSVLHPLTNPAISNLFAVLELLPKVRERLLIQLLWGASHSLYVELECLFQELVHL